MVIKQCDRCGDDHLADYPICRNCEAYRHYTYLSCRCKQCKPSALFSLEDKVRAFKASDSDICRANYAADIRRILPAAFAALTELQAQFGDVNGGTQPRFRNDTMAETAVAAGGVLVIKNDTAKDDAIDIARQLVVNGKASERMKGELDTFDQHTRIIAQAGAEGLTVHSNIHTFRVCALRWIEGEIANLATSPEASF